MAVNLLGTGGIDMFSGAIRKAEDVLSGAPGKVDVGAEAAGRGCWACGGAVVATTAVRGCWESWACRERMEPAGAAGGW